MIYSAVPVVGRSLATHDIRRLSLRVRVRVCASLNSRALHPVRSPISSPALTLIHARNQPPPDSLGIACPRRPERTTQFAVFRRETPMCAAKRIDDLRGPKSEEEVGDERARAERARTGHREQRVRARARARARVGRDDGGEERGGGTGTQLELEPALAQPGARCKGDGGGAEESEIHAGVAGMAHEGVGAVGDEGVGGADGELEGEERAEGAEARKAEERA